MGVIEIDINSYMETLEKAELTLSRIRKTQATAKRFAFHANVVSSLSKSTLQSDLYMIKLLFNQLVLIFYIVKLNYSVGDIQWVSVLNCMIDILRREIFSQSGMHKQPRFQRKPAFS